jgi:hypothetical protein
MHLAPKKQAPARLVKALPLGICAVALILASRGLMNGYSYWLDELFSVAASSDSWQQLYENWVLPDVHPPFYYIILKFWISLFGSAEVTTRLLSLGFAVLTLLAFSVDAMAGLKWRRVLALALVGVSPAFAYYSQETRSNSLALALSSIVTLTAIRLRSGASKADIDIPPCSMSKSLNLIYYIGCITLSITHYFGLIYVFILTMMNFFENRVQTARPRSALLLLVISLWPIWHILVGSLGGKMGGKSWIEVSPPVLGTLNTYLQGCLPFMALNRPGSLFVFCWALLASLIAVAVGSWERVRTFVLPSHRTLGLVADESRFLLLLILIFLSLLSVIDMHTPVSISRSYIVLLPATMLLISNALSMLAGSMGIRSLLGSVALCLAVVIVVLLAKFSYSGLSMKIRPLQDWKQLAAYVRESGVCSDGCFAMGSYGLHSYYFDGIGRIVDLSLEHPSLEDQLGYLNARPRAKVLGFHFASAKVDDLLGASDQRVCIQPSPGSQNATFMILPADEFTGSEEKLGMVKCDHT